jgi:hypothetical protein
MQPLLLGNVTQEVLNVSVLENALVEQVFPLTVELELACENLAVDGLMQEHPELLNVLQAAFKLFIVAQQHVKSFLVFTLPMNKSLKLFARNFYFFPCASAPFFSYFLIALRII